MTDDRDWVMKAGVAHGRWEHMDSPSYDIHALREEYDSTFRTEGATSAPREQPEGDRGQSGDRAHRG